MSDKLNENNFFEKIEKLSQDNKVSVLDVYKKIKNEINSLVGFNSITSNYIALFIYDMIEKKVSLSVFSDVLEEVFNIVPNEKNYSNELYFPYRLFNTRDSDKTLRWYVNNNRPNLKTDPKNNQCSIWDKLCFLFLDIKKEQVSLYENTLPYLKKLIEVYPEKHIGTLHEGNFNSFCADLPIENFQPLIESIENNPAFKIENGNIHWSFWGSYFNYLSSQVYEWSNDTKTNTIKVLKENMQDFDLEFSKNLIGPDSFKKKKTELKINMGLLKFIDNIGGDQIYQWLNNAYYQKINELIDNGLNPQNDYEFSEVIQSVSSSIEVGFSDISFSPPVLDTQKDYLYNWINIKIIETALNAGQKPDLNSSEIEYIKNIFDEKKCNIIGVSVEIYLRKELLGNYLNYCKWDKELPQKNNIVTKKHKI